MQPFTMSIEDKEGHSYQHGFHLGSQEALARSLVQSQFHDRRKARLPTVTIALMREGKIIDVFYGDKWQSEL